MSSLCALISGTFLPSTVCVFGLMADNDVWVSVFMPPLVLAERGDIFVFGRKSVSQECGGSPPPTGMVPCLAASTGTSVGPGDAGPVASAAAAEASPRRGSRGWGSSSDEDDCYHAAASSSKRAPAPCISSSSPPPPPPDSRTPTTPPVSLPPGDPVASCFSYRRHAHRVVDCPSAACGRSLLVLSRGWTKVWVDGWRSRRSCDATKRATLVSHLYPAREPPPDF